MQVPYLLAADYATKEPGGKLSLIGIFQTFNVNKFPTIHRTMYLVIKFEATHSELDVEHDVIISFIDEDAKHILELPGKILIPRPTTGSKASADLIVEIRDLKLERPGPHEFVVNVDRNNLASLDIEVIQIDSEK